ncbi:hypothetical protein M405DRAFT_870295 [Rhizopogon salebrosus TDB-379]|nr:hypothetical protein M405DRAFT_870295 [Rhizopogon salebrosus TDB-379]
MASHVLFYLSMHDFPSMPTHTLHGKLLSSRNAKPLDPRLPTFLKADPLGRNHESSDVLNEWLAEKYHTTHPALKFWLSNGFAHSCSFSALQCKAQSSLSHS